MTATITPNTVLQQQLERACDRSTPTTELHTIYHQVAVGNDDTATIIRRACLRHPNADEALLEVGVTNHDDFTANLAKQIIQRRQRGTP